jgi:DNA-binding CsgD family transcriptional regulator
MSARLEPGAGKTTLLAAASQLAHDPLAMSASAAATAIRRDADGELAVSECWFRRGDRSTSATGLREVLGGLGSGARGRRSLRARSGLMMLLGRRDECEVLDGVLTAARAGRSGALVLRGEPGIGKTSLLEYAIRSASDLKLVRAVGMESERELAFAALHQLCAPMLDRIDRLPAPQRDALAITFGLSAGSAPDRFLVGLAVLSLLSEAAEERPLLCVVDDAQWLDRASGQVLGFVARRLLAESVVMLFGMRHSSEELRGLRELVVGGLLNGDARQLLRSGLKWPLDERVSDQIVAETRGNPLALLELPQGLSPAQLAGGFGLPGALPLEGRIEESFVLRLEALPEDTQRLLLLAAAEPAGDPALVLRAGKLLGIARPTLGPAERAGLLDVGGRVRFRHPLVRSGVYGAASPDERREVHRALAEATPAEVDPDRRAWHLAEATAGADEDVATELERAAGRAQARGGLAAAAAFLDQAAKLTPELTRRGHRALAAAQAKLQAGTPDAALAQLATAEAGLHDDLALARVDLLRAQAAFAMRLGSDAPPLLLQAARRLETLDVALARDTYLDAISAAQFAGALAHGGGPLEVALAARAASQPEGPARPNDLLLDGLAIWITEGCAAGAPLVKRALSAFCTADIPSEDALRWLGLASRIAGDGPWDHDTWEALVSRHVRLSREAGALSLLPIALTAHVYVHLFAGEITAAASLSEELQSVADATSSQLAPYGQLGVAAWRGWETETLVLIEATVEEAVARGEGLAVTSTQWAAAVLYNGLARYEDALAAAEQASRPPEAMGFAHWTLAELIEAAARVGKRKAAADALDALAQTTRPSATDWALGIEARSRALLSDGAEAECLYREAIDRLGRGGIRAELGRAHLLYGEWLRRERRRLEAREQLRIAHEMLSTMGAEAFAARAARELVATGERARRRASDTRDDLTPQEAQIARLARDGLSNPEIGIRLFISPRTVEYHLHKVFGKLEIGSRQELQRALPSAVGSGLAGVGERDPSGVA